MKLLFTVSFLLLNISSFGQTDTTYFDKNRHEVNSFSSAEYYQIIQHNPVDTNIVVKREYYKLGQIQNETNYSNYEEKILDGKLRVWFDNGLLKADIDYKDGKPNGKRLTYWYNGNAKRIDSLVVGKLISGKCFDCNGTKTKYYDYEIMPKFAGGESSLNKFIIDHVKYPRRSLKKGISGRVLVYFVINKDGSISNVKIEKSLNKEYDKEAIRLIKLMPNWIPGKADGNLIRVAYVLPINFTL